MTRKKRNKEWKEKKQQNRQKSIKVLHFFPYKKVLVGDNKVDD